MPYRAQQRQKSFIAAGSARSCQCMLVRAVLTRARIARDYVRDHVQAVHVRATLLRPTFIRAGIVRDCQSAPSQRGFSGTMSEWPQSDHDCEGHTWHSRVAINTRQWLQYQSQDKDIDRLRKVAYCWFTSQTKISLVCSICHKLINMIRVAATLTPTLFSDI
jgi:hypothetical protein